MYELAHGEAVTATMLVGKLGIDAGYLSRLLRGLARRRLVTRTKSAEDGRESHLALSATGRAAFAKIERRTEANVAGLLAPLDESARGSVVASIERIRTLLGDSSSVAPAPYLLRSPRSGDMGWVVARHGEIYAQEFGWDMRFEALVARIVADYVDGFDPEREACWIAERDGVNVGCVFVVRDPKRKSVAKLRLLLVDPSARGMGIGQRLVAECTRFARQAGYRRIELWTNSVLTAARRIYLAEGYELISEERHTSFGKELIGQEWGRPL